MAKKLLTTDELAAYIGLKPNTIILWRVNNIGPPYLKFGGRTIRYDIDEVMKWAERVDPSKEQEQEETKVAKTEGEYQEFSMPKMNFKWKR